MIMLLIAITILLMMVCIGLKQIHHLLSHITREIKLIESSVAREERRRIHKR